MLKHPTALLQGIVDGLKQELEHAPGRRVADLTVTFHVKDEAYDFTLDSALDALANDLYFDERGDWRDAERATVRTS